MQKFLHKPLKFILGLITLYLTAFLILKPDNCITAAKDALLLCQNTIIPSFLPFFVCSGLLSALGFSRLCSVFLSPVMQPLFRLPGCSALAFFLGLVSGYPMGAIVAADLYKSGQCTKTEAQRMSAFCNNSGPIFVLGVVGGNFLGSSVLGAYLYISHILAALVTGILFRFYGKNSSCKNLLPPHAVTTKEGLLPSLGEIIDNSVFSILKICGFIIFFAVAANTLPQGAHLPYLYSLVEITGGLNLLSSIEMSWETKLSLISFFLAFSGLSVMFQVSSILSPKGLSVLPYLWGKLLQGGLAVIFIRLLLWLFPPNSSVFSLDFTPYHPDISPIGTFILSIILMLVCLLILAIFMLTISFVENRQKPSQRQ